MAQNQINNQIGSATTATVLSQIRNAAGQWQGFNDQTDVHGYYSGAGSPEGVVAANIGSYYSDTGAGATGLYYKTTDTLTTGWMLLTTAAAAQVGFSAYLSATTPNVTGSALTAVVICDTEFFDTGGDYDSGTGVFTAPVNGVYVFTTAILINNLTVAGNLVVCSIATTPNNIVSGDINSGVVKTANAGEANFLGMSATGIFALSATDTVSIGVRVSGEAADTVGVFGDGTGTRTVFSGALLYAT